MSELLSPLLDVKHLPNVSAFKAEDESWKKVLFIDDDPLILRAVKRELSPSELEVDLVRTGEIGLERLGQTTYSVVAADYRMPGIDGIELLEQLRRSSPDTVRVLVTGAGDFELAINAINRVGLFRFITKPWQTGDLRSTLELGARQFALVQSNKRLTHLLETKNEELVRINEALESTVQRRTSDLLGGLLNALDLRDTETQWHSRRVALYSRRLAEQLALPLEEQLDVERGALLHDIGKIGVSDTILLKPGKLTPEEWEEMKRHTIYGYNMIKGIDFLGKARLLVRSHHERHDGHGYPDGLQDGEIYIGARIFAVIDTYDAMTSDRPYRKALPPEVAREEIANNRGTQFDPRCVDAFLAIPQTDLDAIHRQASTNVAAGLD